ncbi:MAG: YggS family pyridoxal phosphate-dependent enzyme [Armatimonadota bacterium]
MPSNLIAENVVRLRERIANAAARAGRSSEEVLLLGVTKTMRQEAILDAVRCGVTSLGENYVQEAREKIPAVTTAADAEGIAVDWHLIGHLQTNKAKYCPELFSIVETVDNFPLAKELAKAASKHSKISQRVLVEVNLSGDPMRAGISPEETIGFCEQLVQIPGIVLEGLMGIAAYNAEAEQSRPAFRRLRSLWDQLPGENRKILSMGMSGDFEVAIEEGTTLIRIGSALFGARPPRPV